MEKVKIVACDDRHALAILAILNEAIVTSTALYDYVPRQPSAIEAWLENKKKENYPIIGAENENGILMGFASYGPFRNFPAYKYSIEHSVYVEKSFRGKGIAKKLMLELIEAAKNQGYHMMIAGIDSANEASIRLHETLNFERCAKIKHAGFKFNRWLDLEFYQLLLPTPEHPSDG